MLKKVKLHGELADFIGCKEFDAVINSAAEAIRFLVTNFPKLEAHMADRYYQVLINDYEIDESELNYPIGQADVNIVPVITGSGGGTRKLLLGAVLLGVGFAAGGGVFGPAIAKNLGAIGFVKNVGLALALQGATELLFPLPKPKDFSNEEDPRISFSFSGVQNTSRAGTSIPLCYGEIVTGSVVISAGIDTHQVVAEN